MMKLREAICALVAISTASITFAQTDPHAQHQSRAGQAKPAPMAGMDMEKCMRDMQAAEAKLDALVSKMNSTQGADRIDATTAVINQLVTSNKQMMSMCHMMMMKKPMGAMGGPSRLRHGKAMPKGHAGHH